MLKKYFLILIFFVLISGIKAQSIDNPVVDFKSHPTLNITKIVKSGDSTIFYMSLKNEVEKGFFCVNNDVFISIPGKRIKFEMIKSSGIENCPDMHRFTSPGQMIDFKLYFPAISDTIKILDLVENCTDNCFAIRGIHLDNAYNKEVHNFDVGVNYYRSGNVQHALPFFLDIVNKSTFKKSKHYAYATYIIPVIYEKIGYLEDAKKSFQKLLDSDIVEKDYFIRKIREIPYFKDK